MSDEHGTGGVHVIFDMYGISKVILNDNEFIKESYKEAIIKSGANIRKYNEEIFEPEGITFTYILSESHASCHVYPEHGCLMGCIHTCGEHVNPVIALNYLIEKLKPEKVYQKTLTRGIGEIEVGE